MVAVRIPGPDSIDAVAPARDPGVRADPNDFGANIGESLSHFGNAAVEVGALLDRKREAAAAAMALPEATAKFQLQAIQRNQKIATGTPTSAAGTGQSVDADLTPTQDQIVSETKAKYGLNDLDAAKLTGHLTTLRGHAVVNAVTQANNQIVQGLSTAHNDTVQTIASNALATGDVDGALKQVDQSVSAMRGIVPENDLNVQATKSKKTVVDAVINGLKASGTKEGFDKAEALTGRFYGSVPKSDMYNAIYAQESGGGSNTSTSVTGARGGMQIQPATFAQYAKPGENIDNPADNQAVGKRIIDDLSAKSGGDPARIAVGYFSGPGNIASPGSPTPWKVDKADPTGKTVSSYVADVTKRLGGVPSKAELPDNERALYFNQQINQARTKTLATASADTENQFTRQIIDANAGAGPLPSRSAIESNPSIGEDTRNSLLAKYDSAASDVIKLQAAMKKFTDPNGGSFNPFDKEDKGNIDRIYNSLGGDINALQVVTNRTGMVPEAAVSTLRGAMVSPDPQKVEQALQVSSNLIGGKYPDVFANVKGGEDLTKDANTFRHYVFDRGMTAAAATAKIMEEHTPEYEQRVKARIKSEDVNDIVKKQLKDGDIRHAFDDSWIPFNDPKLTFNPEMRQRAMGDYEEAFRENFAKNGDVSLSKTLALDEMKRTWGTTQVNGSKTVMKYPPERSPVYAGIENPSEHIAEQAVSAIKEWNGSSDTKSTGNLLEQARAKYPILRNQDYGYTENFKPNSGFLEHWDPGEPGAPSSADKPLNGLRPNDLPIDKHGLEVRDPKTRPIDILGDIVSHNLIHTDPVVKSAYEKLEGSLTSKQNGILQDQYEHAQKEQGETRSFSDWKDASGMPGFFRGYTFQQWPKDFTDKAYTPEQRADLDKLMGYLSKGGSASGEIDRSKLRLDETRNTADRYMRGQPPTYVLSYVDDKGHVQTIPKQFYADPAIMRDKQTAERAAQSAKIQQRVDIDADNADLSRANFGVQ